jgi:two-component system sensor histidine kinase CreC
MVTRPIRKLTEYSRAVRDGDRAALGDLGSGEIADLGRAFEEMRESLEGRKYVERYLQTLTHEIKSPLSGIKGAVELLKEDLPAEKRIQFIGNIERETNRLQSLAEKLLGLSALQRMKAVSQPESISLRDLAEECVGECRALAETKGISLTLRAEQSCTIIGEKFWLKEALLNLLQNSLDFTERGGAIEVELTVSAALAVIAIRDTGSGIPDWALGKIFEQFYSLPRPDNGKKSTGLGLTLVREVMELHGGTVSLKNREQKGAEATLTFPKIRT